MKRSHSSSDGLTDLPESLKKSLAERLGERKCFYYTCYSPVYCTNTMCDVYGMQHSIRMVPRAIGFDSRSLQEIPDARCNYCRIYCVFHLFAGESAAQKYGPMND